MMNKEKFNHPVAIIGAGPVGMAAAAHLAEKNIPFTILEASDRIGANLLDWGHVKVFTPWKYVIDKAAENLLAKEEWQKPDEEVLPTGRQIVEEYLEPLSRVAPLRNRIERNAKVVAITRKRLNKIQTAGRDNQPFVVKTEQNGTNRLLEFSAVIDASGTWQNPNPIGAGGIFAEGELKHADKISYRIPDIKDRDLHRFANKTVAVIGGGHSAINSLLDLAEIKENYPQTTLHWILQTGDLSSVYGGKETDELEARGALGIRIEKLVQQGSLNIHNPVFIHRMASHDEALSLIGENGDEDWRLDQIDEIIANTGGRPNFEFLNELRYQADPVLESVPTLAELIDPNKHSCGTVAPHGELELQQPEKNFYIVGVKSYGRAPTFLMPTGYEQVRSIAAWLAGDVEAARSVQLNLPETGVCTVDFNPGASCCGPSKETQGAASSGGDRNEVEETATTETMNNSCCGPTAPPHSNSKEAIARDVKEAKAVSSCCGPSSSDSQQELETVSNSCCS